MEVATVVGTYALLHTLLLFKLQKPRIWLSLSNALLLSCLSINTGHQVYEHGFNAAHQLLAAPQNTHLADYVIGFFIADMLFGHVYDKATMGVLTGYVHHTAYICLVYYLKTAGHANLIYMCVPFEIPTALLDMNRLDTHRRFNIPFGITFVLCRLIYNMYVIAAVSNYNAAYPCIAGLMLLMHIYWFKTWFSKHFINP
jgi:hypothetical protein